MAVMFMHDRPALLVCACVLVSPEQPAEEVGVRTSSGASQLSSGAGDVPRAKQQAFLRGGLERRAPPRPQRWHQPGQGSSGAGDVSRTEQQVFLRDPRLHYYS